MSENPCPCNLAAWPSATMNTNVLELPMYSAASNRKQEFTLRRSPRPGRRWNLQTSSSPSPTAIPRRRPSIWSWDNLSSHTQKALTDRFGEEEGGALWDRFTVHYTPVHGSWLNQAELEIGLFSKQCLGKRRLGEIRILRAEARAWNRRTNRNRVTINWTFDRKKARKKFKYNYNTKRPET